MRRKERELSSTSDIESIINDCDVCRIGLFDGEMPYIVALNFGYMPGSPAMFYFHCAPEGRKIDIIRSNNGVCFQMDTSHRLTGGEMACDYTMSYRSITGEGTIHIAEDEDERQAGLNCVMNHYTGKSDFTFRPKVMERTTILRLEIESISAKEAL